MLRRILITLTVVVSYLIASSHPPAWEENAASPAGCHHCQKSDQSHPADTDLAGVCGECADSHHLGELLEPSSALPRPLMAPVFVRYRPAHEIHPESPALALPKPPLIQAA